jgi:hypothetical protein
MGLAPDKLMYRGTKVIHASFKLWSGQPAIRFIDSFSFLPTALSKLPKAFGLVDHAKGAFPHTFNTIENANYVGRLPPVEYYDPDSMPVEAREEFLRWHREHSGDEFDMKRDIVKYCRSDVDILRQACLSFRKHFIQITDICPFDSLTLASVCMKIFQSHFLTEEHEVRLEGEKECRRAVKKGQGPLMVNTGKDEDGGTIWTPMHELEKPLVCSKFLSSPIMIVPPGGYCEYPGNFSMASILWLEHVSRKKGIHIQHALNGREFRLPDSKISLDGWSDATKTAYSFHGKCSRVYFFIKCYRKYNP